MAQLATMSSSNTTSTSAPVNTDSSVVTALVTNACIVLIAGALFTWFRTWKPHVYAPRLTARDDRCVMGDG